MLAVLTCNAQSVQVLKDGKLIAEFYERDGWEFVFKEKKEDPADPYNGHEYVDLGLPSGLKWATCNVGATKPEDYGDYFAWGETEPKSIYNWSTYKYMQEGYSDYEHVTKYTFEDGLASSYWYDNYIYVGTTVDGVTYKNKTVLDPEDDAAHVNWGGDWRMPTLEEQYELLTICTWTWITSGDVNGYVVTGPNGNSIFLPCGHNRSSFEREGNYWANSCGRYSGEAHCLCFYSDSYWTSSLNRFVGFSVRPVCP